MKSNYLQFHTFQSVNPLIHSFLTVVAHITLCNNVELFKFLDDTYKSKVKVRNGKAVEVKGRGTVSISTISGIKTITDVLYTPDMSQNLLSFGQMLENNYSLHFKNRECVVSDPSGVELFYVKMSNKMFSVDWEKRTSRLTLLLHKHVQTYAKKGLVTSI